ncbi:MAG: hypothetical protein SFW67_33520 [Myxococcaceae bacterium]|nr:hypothetical protein [Myxococcaceae bacterium]
MRLALLFCVVSTTGCVYLRNVPLETKVFATSRACAQGPLRLETTTLGSRWGEWYELRLVSPRALKGHVRWSVGDERREGTWVTSHRESDGRDERSVTDTVFDSRRCIERPPDVVASSAPPAPQQPAAGWAAPPPQLQGAAPWPPQPIPVPTPQRPPPATGLTGWSATLPPASAPPNGPSSPGAPAPAPAPGWTPYPAAPPPIGVRVELGVPPPTVPAPAPAPAFEPIAFPQGPDVSPVQLVETSVTSGGGHSAPIIFRERRNEDANAPPPLPAGRPVVIEVWSETPNDYLGATFIFRRGPVEPNVSEAEWLAELEKRKVDEKKAADEAAAREAAEAKVRQAERDRRLASENERRKLEAAELERRREAYAAEREARLAAPKEESAYERERRARYAQGLPAPSRPDEAYVEERRREFERRQAEAAAEEEARRRWAEESERRWREAEARRPKPRPPPPGPPPPAPAQTIPPRPAPYVLWVDGYYEWTGAAWVWLEGWWKVNEAERQRYELTARLPAPAPRVETPPPCPVPEGIWQAGTWVWNLQTWVWLPGVWVSTQRPVHRAVPVTPRGP